MNPTIPIKPHQLGSAGLYVAHGFGVADADDPRARLAQEVWIDLCAVFVTVDDHGFILRTPFDQFANWVIGRVERLATNHPTAAQVRAVSDAIKPEAAEWRWAALVAGTCGARVLTGREDGDPPTVGEMLDAIAGELEADKGVSDEGA